MSDILKITEYGLLDNKIDRKKFLIYGLIICLFVSSVISLGRVLYLFYKEGGKLADAAQNFLPLLIGIFGILAVYDIGIYFSSYSSKSNGFAIIIDDQYLYMTRGPATLWHVEIMRVTIPRQSRGL